MKVREIQRKMRSSSNLLGITMWHLMILLGVFATFLYTSVGDLHEDSHAHDKEPHEHCLVCLIFTGSIDPTSPEPFQIAVLHNCSETTVFCGTEFASSADFWVVVSARPPPTVV